MSAHDAARRPIKVRGAAWARAVVSRLDRLGVRPNAVSLASVGFALIGAAGLIVSAESTGAASVVLLAGTPVWIGLRSICNLLDGMLAVEHGRGTRSGIVFNEFPDRLSDLALLAAAGFAASPASIGQHLGWAAAAVALIVTYSRVLGASCGRGHDFRGPMAKPQRMAALAVGSIAAAIETGIGGGTVALSVALGVIIMGGVITVARRLVRLVRGLESETCSPS